MSETPPSTTPNSPNVSPSPPAIPSTPVIENDVIQPAPNEANDSFPSSHYLYGTEEECVEDKVPRKGDHFLRVKVPRASLRNAVGNGLHHRGLLARLLQLQKHVDVEAQLDSRTDSVFYAPFTNDEHLGYFNSRQHPFSTSTGTINTTSSDKKKNPKKRVQSSLNNNAPNRKNHDRRVISSLTFQSLQKQVETDNTFMNAGLNLDYDVDGRTNIKTKKDKRPPTLTQFIPVSPASRPANLVTASDNFEMSFIGMSVPPKDTLSRNELFLYSLRSHVYPDEESDESDIEEAQATLGQSAKTDSSSNEQSGQAKLSKPQSSKSSSGKRKKNDLNQPNILAPPKDGSGIFLQASDVPQIHYDPKIDGHDTGSIPNSFLPVPASKALFRQHKATNSRTSIIPFRCTIMEIDKISTDQAQTISKIENAEGYISQATSAIPYADIVASAVSIANAVGRKALRNYAKPDHVLSVDFEFRLFNGMQSSTTNTANNYTALPYLRYGYYFFLAQRVDATLYAQTDVSSQNVQLLLKRVGVSDSRLLRKGEKAFFPLSGVPYVVVKVAPGLTRQRRERTRAMAAASRSRLEHILHVNNTIEILSGMK